MGIPNKLELILMVVLLSVSSLIVACSSDKQETPTPVSTSTLTPIATLTSSPTETRQTVSRAGELTMQTLDGTVKGFEGESNTWVWKAIPFAKPPVGEPRWKAP